MVKKTFRRKAHGRRKLRRTKRSRLYGSGLYPDLPTGPSMQYPLGSGLMPNIPGVPYGQPSPYATQASQPAYQPVTQPSYSANSPYANILPGRGGRRKSLYRKRR